MKKIKNIIYVYEAEKSGVGALAVKVDVTHPNEVKRMVHEELEKFGRLDVLVNNAGMLYLDTLYEVNEMH